MMYTVGIDVGSSSVKTVLMKHNAKGEASELLSYDLDKIRRRNTTDVIVDSFQRILKGHQLQATDIAYVASTGEGELVDFRKGHFYSMTSHARGALFLEPAARGIVDIGALHAKALTMDERSKVLAYRMTSQCASGSGQFLENIGRYLGVSTEDIGELSLKGEQPESVSGICAVLAETDVINMVSRGISTGNILKGIHISMGRRLVTLLKNIKAEGLVLVTGGLAHDKGLLAVMQSLADKDNTNVQLKAHELSSFAGAIGSAIWAAFRQVRINNAPVSALIADELKR